jgi:hypothetical protein
MDGLGELAREKAPAVPSRGGVAAAAKIIVRVDLDTLLRGYTAEGEVGFVTTITVSRPWKAGPSWKGLGSEPSYRPRIRGIRATTPTPHRGQRHDSRGRAAGSVWHPARTTPTW